MLLRFPAPRNVTISSRCNCNEQPSFAVMKWSSSTWMAGAVRRSPCTKCLKFTRPRAPEDSQAPNLVQNLCFVAGWSLAKTTSCGRTVLWDAEMLIFGVFPMVSPYQERPPSWWRDLRLRLRRGDVKNFQRPRVLRLGRDCRYHRRRTSLGDLEVGPGLSDVMSDVRVFLVETPVGALRWC